MEAEETTHLAIGDHRDNAAADYSVKIKTKSVDNKSKVIQMAYLSRADGKENGEIYLDFGINQVWIVYCQPKRVDLSQNTPIDAEKVWNIVRTAEPRIVVYCNGVEVFNYLLSDETCPYTWSKWSDAWMGTDIVGVKFDPIDRTYIAGYMIGKSQCWQARPSPLHPLYYLPPHKFFDRQDIEIFTPYTIIPPLLFFSN